MGWFGHKAEAKKVDQRRFHRVGAGDLKETMSMSVLAGLDRFVPVEWANVSAGGTKFSIANNVCPFKLEVGATFTVHIELEGTSLDIKARLVRIESSDEDSVSKCGVEFLDLRSLLSKTHGKIGKHLNRRKAFRVGPSDRISVEFSHQGGSATGRLHDISMGGIGVEFETLEDAPPVDVEDLQVCFGLSEDSVDLKIAVRARHCTEVGDKINVGVSLEMGRGADAEKLEDTAVDYVMGRQREMRQH